MKPSDNDIDNALATIQFAELPDNHPRKLARTAIAEFRSNAQREGLPTTNLHDDKGAELLDRDEVVRASYPTYAMMTTKRSLLARILGR